MQQHPEAPPASLAHFTDIKCKTVLWSDESTFQTVFGNHGLCVLQAKEEIQWQYTVGTDIFLL